MKKEHDESPPNAVRMSVPYRSAGRSENIGIANHTVNSDEAVIVETEGAGDNGLTFEGEVTRFGIRKFRRLAKYAPRRYIYGNRQSKRHWTECRFLVCSSWQCYEKLNDAMAEVAARASTPRFADLTAPFATVLKQDKIKPVSATPRDHISARLTNAGANGVPTWTEPVSAMPPPPSLPASYSSAVGAQSIGVVRTPHERVDPPRFPSWMDQGLSQLQQYPTDGCFNNTSAATIGPPHSPTVSPPLDNGNTDPNRSGTRATPGTHSDYAESVAGSGSDSVNTAPSSLGDEVVNRSTDEEGGALVRGASTAAFV